VKAGGHWAWTPNRPLIRWAENITVTVCTQESGHRQSMYSLVCEQYTEPGFVNVYGAQESIPSAYVSWRADTTNRVLVPYRPARLHRLAETIPGFVKRLQIRAQKIRLCMLASCLDGCLSTQYTCCFPELEMSEQLSNQCRPLLLSSTGCCYPPPPPLAHAKAGSDRHAQKINISSSGEETL
jgi:hypothetical protein